MGWPGWHVPALGLWNFHQPVKEVKSAGKIFIRCPYDFASQVGYTVNVRKFEPVYKNLPPCDFASDMPMVTASLSFCRLDLSLYTLCTQLSTYEPGKNSSFLFYFFCFSSS